MISGFVFTHVYLRRPTGLRDFWVARIARLYPMHLAMLLTVAALQWASWQVVGAWQIYGNNDARHFALQLVMAGSWSTLSRGLSFDGPIWSVSFELVAYVAFFASLGLLRRGGIAVAAAGCGLAAWLQGADWIDPPLLRLSTFGCVAYFYWGVCLWFAVAACARAKGQIQATLIAGLACSLVAATAVAWRAGLAAPAVALASAALVAGAAGLDMRRSGRASPAGAGPFEALGDMSYSLYLVHVPLQMALLTGIDLVAPGDRSVADAAWLLPAWLAASCLAAHWAHRWLERPAGRALRRLARPRPKAG